MLFTVGGLIDHLHQCPPDASIIVEVTGLLGCVSEVDVTLNANLVCNTRTNRLTWEESGVQPLAHQRLVGRRDVVHIDSETGLPPQSVQTLIKELTELQTSKNALVFLNVLFEQSLQCVEFQEAPLKEVAVRHHNTVVLSGSTHDDAANLMTYSLIQ